MNRKIFFSMLVSVGLLAFCFGCDNYDETIIEKSITSNGAVKGISVEGVWNVNVVFSEENNGVFIQYSAYAEDHITVEMRSDGYLYFKTDKLKTNGHDLVLNATVTAAFLEEIKGSGAANIKLSGAYECGNVNVALSGASTLKDLSATASGANANLSGASTIGGFDFSGETLNFRLSGASSVKQGLCYTNQVDFDLSGASQVDIAGATTSGKFVGSGASKFYTMGLEMNNLSISLEGASFAEVHAKETITGNLSGASTLKYKIGANVTGVQTSGGSSIVQVP